MRARARRRTEDVLTYIILTIALLFAIFPLYWMVNTSLKPELEYYASPPTYFPTNLTTKNFNYIWREYSTIGLFNSTIIATFSSMLAIFLGSFAAYALTRYDFRGRKDVAFWILSQRMFPAVAVVIPIFVMFKTLGLLDTHLGMILVHTAVTLPFAVWMLRGFLMELPVEIEEAALIDGCSRPGCLLRIVLPMIAPGLAATAIFCYILSWNEFIFALILTRSVARTIPIELVGMQSTQFYMFGELTALCTFAIIPVIIVTLALQKYIVRGLTFGAVKG